jgi:hypothetical protein
VIYLVVAAAAAVVLGALLLGMRRPPKGDEVERFHRARAMTTEWSRRYAATGRLDLPTPAPAEGSADTSTAEPVSDSARTPTPAQH